MSNSPFLLTMNDVSDAGQSVEEGNINNNNNNSNYINNNYTNNNINNTDTNSMVIAVSPSHAEYIESSFTKRKHLHEYFCLFCAAKFNCKLDAYPHYGEHLEYKPVVCLLCEHRFHDTDAFNMHHQLNHPQASDLMYEIHEDQNIERWVDEFLEFQNSAASKRLLLKCSCGLCCPVCEKIKLKRSNLPIQATPCFNHVATNFNFLNHLHQHIAYHAYECSPCQKMGNTTRFASMDMNSINHLREIHSIKDLTTTKLARLFAKTLSIAKLERFIVEYAQKKKHQEKKWHMHKIEQINSKKMMMKQLLQYPYNAIPPYLQDPQMFNLSHLSHRDGSNNNSNHNNDDNNNLIPGQPPPNTVKV